MQSAEKTGIVLGKVTSPSGTVILIDFGLMDLWTHDKPPLVPEGVLSAEALRSANGGCDFKIEGKDALAAGKRFDRQPHPLFLYDIPRHSIDEFKENFDSLINEEGFQAKLVELPDRVPPLKRAEYATAHDSGAGEVFLHGLHAIAVSGLPRDKEMLVEGRRMDEGPFAQHWRDISLVVAPGAAVSGCKRIGHVAVDMARLMFCDLESMGKWEHQETIDGLADFVFWGKDAARIAKKFGGNHIEGSIYGFVDQPVADIANVALQAQKHLELHHLVAACDFRPHSDHWRMLKAVSERDTESGEIELGGSQCCGFMTSWGDGFFPVYFDHDSNGTLVRIRIDLGTEETIRGMHLVNRFA